jgi:hypothetical protein
MRGRSVALLIVTALLLASPTLGAEHQGSPAGQRGVAEGCLDLPRVAPDQGEPDDLDRGVVHLPRSRWGLLPQDQARALLQQRGGRTAGRVSEV